jgi:hypothetical protein
MPIDKLYISGIFEQDQEVLAELNGTIISDDVETVVKQEAYKRVCELYWEEVNLETLEVDMNEYRNGLLDLISERR